MQRWEDWCYINRDVCPYFPYLKNWGTLTKGKKKEKKDEADDEGRKKDGLKNGVEQEK